MEKKDKTKLIVGVSILALALIILGYQMIPKSEPPPPVQTTATEDKPDIVNDKSGAKSVKKGSRAYIPEPSK